MRRLSRLLGFPAIALATMALTSPANASCVRHFYNKSGTVWYVAFSFAGDCVVGTAVRSVCRVPPGRAVEIRYSGSGGVVRLFSASFDGSFGFQGSCYIDHSGNTGRAVLNDPADGDIVALDGRGTPVYPVDPFEPGSQVSPVSEARP